MFRKLSSFISIVFHPLLMPMLGFILIFGSGTYLSFIPIQGKKLILLIVATGTFILPVSLIPAFMYFNWVKKIEMETSRERIYPLIFTSFFYYLTYFMLKKIHAPAFLEYFMLGTTIAVFINLLVSFRWKISAHALGMGGLTALVTGLTIISKINYLPMFILVVLASGLVCSSRLFLDAHKPADIYIGYLIGFLSVFSMLYFY